MIWQKRFFHKNRAGSFKSRHNLVTDYQTMPFFISFKCRPIRRIRGIRRIRWNSSGNSSFRKMHSNNFDKHCVAKHCVFRIVDLFLIYRQNNWKARRVYQGLRFWDLRKTQRVISNTNMGRLRRIRYLQQNYVTLSAFFFRTFLSFTPVTSLSTTLTMSSVSVCIFSLAAYFSSIITRANYSWYACYMYAYVTLYFQIRWSCTWS